MREDNTGKMDSSPLPLRGFRKQVIILSEQDPIQLASPIK